MTTALDYAFPALPKPPNRLVGWPLGVMAFCLSLYVAKESISDGYWLTHYSGCGFGYGRLQASFWSLIPIQALAGAAWPLCAHLGAGLPICRVGVVVGALCWLGSFFYSM